MNSITRDPLLAIAKGILWFLMACMVLAAVSCLVAMPLMHIYQGKISIEMANEGMHTISTTNFIWAVTAILACCVALVLVLFRIFQLLKHIVDTVGLGDPFVPENARRLTQMAWLTLAVQLVTIPIGSLGVWIASIVNKSGSVHTEIDNIGVGLSGNGLLLVLILFILARVFRQGAAMRDELEGTV
jgi:hypothetical protein